MRYEEVYIISNSLIPQYTYLHDRRVKPQRKKLLREMVSVTVCSIFAVATHSQALIICSSRNKFSIEGK